MLENPCLSLQLPNAHHEVHLDGVSCKTNHLADSTPKGLILKNSFKFIDSKYRLGQQLCYFS